MSEQQTWFGVEITVNSEASEAIEFGLNELDASGTEINNLGVKQQETLSVVGYFNDLPDEKIVKKTLVEALRIYGFTPDAIREIRSRRIGNVDWLFEWKKHWKPTEVGNLIVAPTWENIENSDKIIIRIEPNMAFGTGTHATTQLCLKAIEQNYQSAMTFLDVGTGTGILAIAARKLGVESSEIQNLFQACDTDETSIKIARENAELNEVENINFYVGSISDETPKFDFVCANLTIDVILPMLSRLLEKAEKILILSGILKAQENLITKELRDSGISDFKIATEGEWISVTVTR